MPPVTARDDFWEQSWQAEDPEQLITYLDAWRHALGAEIALFRSRGVRTLCDAACGFGAYAAAFAEDGFSVSAFDLSPTAVEITRRGLSRLGLKAEVKTASILETGYPDACFDAAIAASVLDHLTVPDAQKALAELQRIVRPGGLLLVSFDTPEEDDLTLAHQVLSDGTFLYGPDTGREGMLFHPCGEEERRQLLAGHAVLWEHTAPNGKHTAILER